MKCCQFRKNSVSFPKVRSITKNNVSLKKICPNSQKYCNFRENSVSFPQILQFPKKYCHFQKVRSFPQKYWQIHKKYCKFPTNSVSYQKNIISLKICSFPQEYCHLPKNSVNFPDRLHFELILSHHNNAFIRDVYKQKMSIIGIKLVPQQPYSPKLAEFPI